MTREEFGHAIAYLTAAIGKALGKESLEVYYDLLGDLPQSVFLTAVKRVAIEHKWANFPTVAELREAAVETMAGEVKLLSPSEAWRLAWLAVGKIDPELDGSFERHTKGLPALVREAIVTFGVNAFCYGDEPVGVVRGQFLKVFEQLAARQKRELMLPASVKRAIGAPANVRQIAAGIGEIPSAGGS